MGEIRVGINYDGTERGAEQLDGLVERLDEASASTNRVKTATDQAKQSQAQMAAAVRGALTEWNSLGSAVGQAASAVGRLGPEFGRLGATLGSAGQSVQSVINALASPSPASLVSAVVAVSSTLFDAIGAWNDYRDAQDAAARSAREAVNAISAAREQRDRRVAVESQRAPEDLDIAAAAVASRRGELARATLDANRLRSSGSTDDFQRAEAARTQAQRALDRALDTEREISGELTRQAAARGAASAEERELARLREEQARELAEQEAILEEAGLGANSGRRGGGRGSRDDSRDDVGPEAAWERAMRSQQELRQRAHEQRLAQEAEIEGAKRQLDDWERQSIEDLQQKEADRAQAALDAIRAESEARDELRDKMKEAAREQQRANLSLASEAANVAARIATAYSTAFQQAIEGTMSLEEAVLATTKMLLKSFGEELIAKGIGKVLEGIAEIPSPTAYVKMAGGGAMVAFGVGLGAAGAAIPSPGAKGAEQPREEPRDQRGGGPMNVTIIMGPTITAGTTAQLGRQLRRQLGGDRILGASLAVAA